MEANKILSADILDLIFEDRNKDYGAYNLRKTYNRRILKALIITASVAHAWLCWAHCWQRPSKARTVISKSTR